jgi:5'-deoxynucleotidase
VKQFNPEIKVAYGSIEAAARDRLFGMIPDPLKPDYEALFRLRDSDRVNAELVKAADRLCAYIKCLEERTAGNPEFAQAEKTLQAAVERIDLPEVRYFIETFVPSFRLTLDELN